jgi:hypothetical protein
VVVRLRAFVTVLLVIVRAATVLAAGVDGASEYELKAAFLFNFAKYVDWPDQDPGGAGPPVCIGVVGPDPFGATLDHLLAGKTVHARPIALRRFASIDVVHGCHVVFVSHAAEPVAAPDTWSRPGVLTVGETDAFLERGGVIAFAMEGGKLRFSINAAAADRAGLKLSSQLLKLALRVTKEGG